MSDYAVFELQENVEFDPETRQLLIPCLPVNFGNVSKELRKLTDSREDYWRSKQSFSGKATLRKRNFRLKTNMNHAPRGMAMIVFDISSKTKPAS